MDYNSMNLFESPQEEILPTAASVAEIAASVSSKFVDALCGSTERAYGEIREIYKGAFQHSQDQRDKENELIKALPMVAAQQCAEQRKNVKCLFKVAGKFAGSVVCFIVGFKVVEKICDYYL